MKYALVLERSSETCNDTSTVLGSLGYLITPVFSPKKALHAAHMIQFDLIVTWTTSIPGDRRSLTGELARCSPGAAIVLLADPQSELIDRNLDGVTAILYRPLTAGDLEALVEGRFGPPALQSPPLRSVEERRKRAVD